MRKRETDRRHYGAANRFPITDYSGCIIPFNRSRRPDRRLLNYSVCEINSEEYCLYDTDPFYGVR